MARGHPGRSKGRAATVRLAAWSLVLALAAACSSGASAPQDPDGDAQAAPEVERDAADDDPAEDVTAAQPDREEEPEPEQIAEPPPPPEGRDELVGRARRLLESTLGEADGGVLAVHVIDEHGREVLTNDADTDVLPASTLKIVTAAAVLRTFGPDATFETRVETTAPVAADGTIRGDVVLVGGGDPALATEEYGRWVYPARPRTPLEELAEELVTAGVQRVHGDVIGRVSGFDGPQVAAGWPDRYFADLDARYSSGLTVDGGLRTIVEYPEPEPDGDEGDGDEPSATDAGEQDDAEARQRDDGEAADPEDLPDPIVRVEHAAEPAAHATAEFVRVLEEHDVEVVGEPTLEASDQPVVGRLASVQSAPVSELLRFAVQRSDNQLTDGLFRAVGRARTGNGSFSGGERALQQVLTGLDIEAEGTRFADGSGLSRDDRVTARVLVELDRRMRASRHAPTWASLMAVMGESGTLAKRLRGTLAEGRFVGKTGTLRDVSGLVGTVRGSRGRAYHLAVIANDQGELRWLGRTFADELVLLLTADLEGCTTSLDGDDTGALGLPPLAIAC